ncbi:MAG: cytochrome c [Rhizobiaceae bacterium]|nr:cytochrome c [Rhizobiaceae bacterium]
MKTSLKSGMTATALLLSFGTAIAFAGPIEDRKAKMKEVGKQTGIIGKMVKGETAFDGQAALAAYVAMGNAGTGFGELFPEDSKTGGETTASPKIWDDRAGFEAAGKKFGEDLGAAIQSGVPADLNALKASFGSVAQNCKACHTDYRIKKN